MRRTEVLCWITALICLFVFDTSDDAPELTIQHARPAVVILPPLNASLAASNVQPSRFTSSEGRQAGQQETRPLSVLLVLTDQWRAGAFSFSQPNKRSGVERRDPTYPSTPHLDAFAQESIVCTRAFATNPVCTPSRATILTGRWSHEHGLIAVNLMLPRTARTIAMAFNATGAYNTGYIGKLHIDGDARPGFVPHGWRRRGFSIMEGFNRGHAYFDGKTFTNEGKLIKVPGYEPTYQTDRAMHFMNAAASRPFFLVLSWGPPHNPFTPPEAYKRRRRTFRWSPNVPGHLQSSEAEATLSGYLGLCESLDHEFGRLMQFIDGSAHAESTLVIFTADHGDSLFSHGDSDNHKNTFFEESWRVPLMLRFPKAWRRQRHLERSSDGRAWLQFDQPMTLADLMPTALGFAVMFNTLSADNTHSSSAPEISAANSADLPGALGLVGVSDPIARKWSAWYKSWTRSCSGRDLSRRIYDAMAEEARARTAALEGMNLDEGVVSRGPSEKDELFAVGEGAMQAFAPYTPEAIESDCGVGNYSIGACGEWRAVVSQSHKLVLLRFQTSETTFGVVVKFLFDNDVDPFELHNLADAPEAAEVKAKLLHHFMVWQGHTNDHFPTRTRMEQGVYLSEGTLKHPRPMVMAEAESLFRFLPTKFKPDLKPACWHTGLGGHQRLHCIPHFFLAGFPKCGTTDFFDKISQHPEVFAPRMKEPHWWSFHLDALRNGAGAASEKATTIPGSGAARPFSWYLSLFQRPVHEIRSSTTLKHRGITLDASASTIWAVGRGDVLLPEILNAALPLARFIVLVRNPTTRAYSDYTYFNSLRGQAYSESDFHTRVVSDMDSFLHCLMDSTVLDCGRKSWRQAVSTNTTTVRLWVGMYSVFIKLWWHFWAKESFLVLRLEDLSSDPEAYYRRACQFLGITASPGVVRRMLSSAATEDSPGNTFTGKKEPMRQETQKLLDDFYNPFNQELAELLGSRDFLWLPRY